MSRNSAVLAAILAALVLTISGPTVGADWSQWELDNSVARERDWLVIRQPGEGFCYLKQSHDNDPSKMEMIIKSGGTASIITPFFRGISGNVTYRVDNSEPGLISAAAIENASLIELPRNLLPKLEAGRKLHVSVAPKGGEPQTQIFSLLGLTAASQWLARDECQLQQSKEATGSDGTTALSVRLERVSGGKVHVIGETNLPDGMKLMIALRGSRPDYFAQDKIAVSGGAFRSAGFSNRGSALPPGKYEVSVTSSLPRLQPTSVQSVIGQNGENMSGPAVIEKKGKRMIRWTVKRQVE